MASRSASREARRKARPGARRRRRFRRRLWLAAGGALTIDIALRRVPRVVGHAAVRGTPLGSTRAGVCGAAGAVSGTRAQRRRLGRRARPARLCRRSAPVGPGTYRVGLGRMELSTRGFAIEGDVEPARLVSIAFSGGRIAALRDSSGQSAAIVRLESASDRQLVPRARRGPADSRAGGDSAAARRGAARPSKIDASRSITASISSDRARSVRQSHERARSGKARARSRSSSCAAISSRTNAAGGASCARRSWRSRSRLRYDKAEILHAYVNEIYLGQDGARAVHGFGLASRFYFGKPLAELELHELALLVAIVRGPTYYDPRRQRGARARAPQARAAADGRASADRRRRGGRCATPRPRAHARDETQRDAIRLPESRAPPTARRLPTEDLERTGLDGLLDARSGSASGRRRGARRTDSRRSARTPRSSTAPS